MPRRTYDPRNGRRRPYAGMGADWASALLHLLERERRYGARDYYPSEGVSR